MVTVETVSIVFTGLSISLAAFYYISTLRNAQRTQQLQLETRQITTYIQTLGFRDTKFMKTWGDVMYLQEASDYEDWFSKYDIHENLEAWSTFAFISNTFQSVGLLVTRGILDPHIVFDQEGELIIRSWEKMKPIIYGIRKSRHYHSLFDHYESLYHQMTQIREQQHPELEA